MPRLLTASEIDAFKTDGCVVVDDLFDAATLDGWRSHVWRTLGGEPDKPDTWDRAKGHVGLSYEPPATVEPPGNHPAIRAIVHQLGGEDFHPENGGLAVRWPQADKPWAPPRYGHIDGYPGDKWHPFMLGITFSLTDTLPRGGGFTYWPGSHRTTHDYFRANPDHISGGFLKTPNFNWGLFSDRSPRGPVELTGPAGRVLVWHCFLCHEASDNVQPHPRLGLFVRVVHRRQEQLKREVPANLWQHWQI